MPTSHESDTRERLLDAAEGRFVVTLRPCGVAGKTTSLVGFLFCRKPTDDRADPVHVAFSTTSNADASPQRRLEQLCSAVACKPGDEPVQILAE